MTSWLATALAVIIVLLAGCTDMQGVETSGGDSQAQADATPEQAGAASEASEAGQSEAADESETPKNPPEGDKQDEAPERPRPRRPAAVGPDDRGADVRTLQKRLDELGFAPGPVDGVYGPRTTAAVEAFQLLSDLEQSGRANAATLAALEDFESDAPIIEAGDKGKAVKRLQQRLADGPFDPGPDDGEYGAKTVQAVWALEKLAGVPVDGNWGPLDEHALTQLENEAIGEPAEKHKNRWVEVDLSQQLVKVYDPGSSTPVLVSHASSGSGQAWSNAGYSGDSITPLGDFVISRRISGWRESSLDIGRLYNPLYFNGGIALHGALSVPLYPASHGCIRLPMHIADYLPDELPNGTPVHVLS